MKGRNILTGTALYLALLFAVYGKKCINKEYLSPQLTTGGQIRGYRDEYGYPYR